MQLLGEKDEHRAALLELWTLIKFHNPASLLNITGEDVDALVENLRNNYSLEIVQCARDEVVKGYSGEGLSLGVFLNRCFALRGDMQMDMHEVEKETSKRIKQTDVAIKRLELRGIIDPRLEPSKHGYDNMFMLCRDYDQLLTNEINMLKK